MADKRSALAAVTISYGMSASSSCGHASALGLVLAWLQSLLLASMLLCQLLADPRPNDRSSDGSNDQCLGVRVIVVAYSGDDHSGPRLSSKFARLTTYHKVPRTGACNHLVRHLL